MKYIYFIVKILGREISIPLLLLFIFLAVALVSAVVISVVAISYSSQKDQNHSEEFNIRIYTYDYARKRFYCFDKNDMSNTKTFSEDEFLKQFRRSDTYRIKDWLANHITQKSTPNILQVNIKITKRKREYSSLLFFTSINKEKQVIHFESQLLPYFKLEKKSQANTGKLAGKFILRNDEDCIRFLKNSEADILGSIMYINVFTDKKNPTEEEQKTFSEVSLNVRRIINRYLTKSRKMYCVSNTETIVIDTSIVSKLMAINMATTIQNAIQQHLNFNMANIPINCVIGVSIGTQYQGNYVQGKEQAKKMADAMRQGKAKNEKVLLYDETFFLSYEQEKLQKKEVRTIIKNKTYRIYFTPLVDLPSGECFRYTLSGIPFGSSVEDFNDIYGLIQTNDDLQKIFYNDILNHVSRVHQNKKQKLEVGLELPYPLIKKFIRLAENPDKNIKYTLLIRESDLLALYEDPNLTMRNFRDVHKANYKLGLIIDTLSTNMRTRILKQIDYFYIPNLFTSDSFDSTQKRTDLQSIRTAYSSYGVPFVFCGLKHRGEIDFGIINGGKIFQCDDIALPSSRFETISPQLIKEISSEAEKLMPKKPSLTTLFEKKKSDTTK